MNEKHQLSDLQRRLLPMLEWFHSFCAENHLRYYLLGGTMLGAARHQGFIPWDDDIDVGMPRSDYQKFLELTEGRLFGDYVVEGIDSDKPDFLYGYTKVYDTKTTLVENTRAKIRRGIYIDVFPLDGACQRESEIPARFRPIYLRYSLLLARACAINKGRKWYKNAVIYGARAIPGWMLNDKKLMQSIDRMCRQQEYDSCEFIGNFYGNWGVREIMPRYVMGQPKLYSFEGLQVYGACDCDAYLTSLYGDWRKLPPKEKQVTHHDFLLCDLKKSYLG